MAKRKATAKMTQARRRYAEKHASPPGAKLRHKAAEGKLTIQHPHGVAGLAFAMAQKENYRARKDRNRNLDR